MDPYEDIVSGEEFGMLDEGVQIKRLQGESDVFRASYANDPEASTELLRSSLKNASQLPKPVAKPQADMNPEGDSSDESLVRQAFALESSH